MTHAELQTDVLRAVGENPAAPRYFTAQQATDALNQAQRVFAFLTLCLEGTATFTAQPGQVWNAFAPTGLIVALRVEIGGYRIWPERLKVFSGRNAYWQNHQEEPQYYAQPGPKLIALHPAPAVETTATVRYARLPVALAAGGDIPEVPEPYHRELVNFAVWRLRLREGAQELQIGRSGLRRFFRAAKQHAEDIRARSLAERLDALPSDAWYRRLEKSKWWTAA